MSDRDVGAMGESKLVTWCCQVGLVANKSVFDVGGWDYLVEHKSLSVPPGLFSLDHLPAPPRYHVQVKSTDVGLAPDIKLSNWVRLIDPSLAAFVLVLEFGGQDEPIGARLVHVDEEIIGLVLKRLRSMDLQDGDSLHRHTMSVPSRARDQLPTLNGAALRAALEAAVGPNARGYYEKKKRWHEIAGYAEARVHVQVRAKAESERELEDRLVEFAIGLTSVMPWTLLGIDELRFGIRVPLPSGGLLPQDANMRIHHLPCTEGFVEASTADGVERIRLPCRIYNPRNVFPFLSEECLRFRIATRDVDIVITGRSGAANLTFDLPQPEERRPLAEWLPTFRFVRMLQGGGEPLRLTIEVDRRQMGPAKLRVSFAPKEAHRRVLEAGVHAGDALAVLKVDPDMPVSWSELYEAGTYLSQAAALLKADRADLQVTGDVNASAKDGVVAGYAAAVPVPIGRTLVMAGLAYFGTLECGPPEDGRKQFTLRSLKREIVCLDKITMEVGRTYSTAPYRERIRKWLRERSIDIIPATEEEAAVQRSELAMSRE
jgi:hypothetical protein